MVPITVPTSGPPGPAQTSASADVPHHIPDNSPTGVTSKLELPAAAGAVADLDVAIGSIDHDSTGDLRITLTGPGGRTVTLFDRRWRDGDDLTDTVVDDEATRGLSEGSPPFTGSFRPEQSLTDFDSLDASGTWTLKVADLGSLGFGTLDSWGFTRRDMACG